MYTLIPNNAYSCHGRRSGGFMSMVMISSSINPNPD